MAARKIERTTKPVRYIAKERGYANGQLVEAGEPFTYAGPVGSWMEPVDAAEYAAALATDPQRDDPDYEALPLTALQAVAAEKKVAFKGLEKEALIAAIKAAKEPGR